MTDHVTPGGARRHANALNVLGTHPHLESARQLRSLAAQVEELRRLIGTATDGEEVLRRLAEQNSSLASQVEELTAQVEQMRAVVEAARVLHEQVECQESVGVCLDARTPSLNLGAALAALDEKES